ncbi:hypothetical protein, partial [Streptomyces ureilyticus]|uniref:hypothetical protein n=1 Tax=Streptomyces ureilyticus TaxID=1775131 RepID=UPI0019D2FB9F
MQRLGPLTGRAATGHRTTLRSAARPVRRAGRITVARATDRRGARRPLQFEVALGVLTAEPARGVLRVPDRGRGAVRRGWIRTVPRPVPRGSGVLPLV